MKGRVGWTFSKNRIRFTQGTFHFSQQFLDVYVKVDSDFTENVFFEKHTYDYISNMLPTMTFMKTQKKD